MSDDATTEGDQSIALDELIAARRYRDALDRLDRDPGRSEASLRIARAECYLGLGDPRLAAKEAHAAAVETPGDPMAHILLARSYHALGHHDPAFAEAEAAFRIEPDSARTLAAIALAGSQVKKQRDRAMSAGRRAVKVDPRDVDAFVALATALVANDRPREAMRVCAAGLRLDPDNAALQMMSTEAAVDDGQLGKAARDALSNREAGGGEAAVEHAVDKIVLAVGTRLLVLNFVSAFVVGRALAILDGAGEGDGVTGGANLAWRVAVTIFTAFAAGSVLAGLREVPVEVRSMVVGRIRDDGAVAVLFVAASVGMCLVVLAPLDPVTGGFYFLVLAWVSVLVAGVSRLLVQARRRG